MALYALHLAQVRTIVSSTINFTTIKRYLKAASYVPLKFKQIAPLLNTRDLEAQCMKDVFYEVKG